MSAGGPQSFAELLVAAEIRVAGRSQPAGVLDAATLMATYAGTPMDVAGATLVMLAGDTGVTDVLTLDVRGFSTFRTARGRPFRLVL